MRGRWEDKGHRSEKRIKDEGNCGSKFRVDEKGSIGEDGEN